jgi:hypothetical protein
MRKDVQHCDSERAELLFNDDLTEGLGRMLASVCDGEIGPLRRLAEDRDAAMWCRLAAIQAQFIRVIEGDGERDALLDWLLDFCARKADAMRTGEGDADYESYELLIWAVDLLGDLVISSPLPEALRGWFEEGLIEPEICSLSRLEHKAARPIETRLANSRRDPYNRYVRDAVRDMEWWACFQEKKWEALDPVWRDRLMPDLGAPRLIPTQGTSKRETPKVGRNDPCPCGSGKK